MDIIKRIARALRPARTYKPIWNTLSFAPLTGVRLFFDPTGSWQKKIMSGDYDTFLFEAVSTLKPEGKVIYDIGSHIGFHTLYFAQLVGPQGTVVAFEPNSANFERLRMNVHENPTLADHIQAFNVAASDKAGTVTFTTNNNIESGRSTGGFLDKADTYWSKDVFKQKGFSETTVEAVAVDDVTASLKLPPPQIMKIDVEGAEYQVLLGARQTLTKHKPIIFVEVHSIAAMLDVTQFFASVSYSARIVNRESNGVCYVEAKPLA